MKKILILVCLCLLPMLTACPANVKYEGPEVKSLEYITSDFASGQIKSYNIDFNQQKVTKKEGTSLNVEPTVLTTFSYKDKNQFLKEVYEAGLFEIESHYEKENSEYNTWELIICFESGITKYSIGINDYPKTVFDNCAIPFYSLCKEEVLGKIDDNYFIQSNIQISWYLQNNPINSYGINKIELKTANYKWNLKEITNRNIYELNKEDKNIIFYDNFQYKILLSGSMGKEITKLIIKQYDLNEELTNEKIIYEGSYNNKLEFNIELNKIYLCEFQSDEEQYCQYTFNTKSTTKKMVFSEYRYNTREGKITLYLNEDKTFRLTPFKFYTGETLGKEIKGKYSIINNNNIMYIEVYIDNKKIVLENNWYELVINYEKTTYDLSKYNINENAVFVYY